MVDTSLGSLTGRRILLGTLVVLGVVAVFALLYRFYMVVFLFFVAFSLAVVFEPLANWLQRRGLRREFGLLLVYTVLAAALVLLLASVIPVLVDQTRALLEQFPALYAGLLETLRNQPVGLLRGIARVLPAEVDLPELAGLLQPDNGTTDASPLLSVVTALRILFAVIAVFLMAYFWTLEGDRVVRYAVLRVPPERRGTVRTMIAEIQGKINGYFRGQLILCGTIGLLSGLAYFAIGLPNALLLGVLMAIFEAVPVVGPFLGAIPALLMAASIAPDKVLWVAGAIVVIQVAESNLLVPRILDKAVGVNAVVSLLAITAFGALFGFAVLRNEAPGWLLASYAVGLALLLIFGAVLLVAPPLLAWMRRWSGHRAWQALIGFAEQLATSLRVLIKQPGAGLLVAGESLYIWLCDALVVWFVILALGASLPFSIAAFVALTVDVLAAVPLTPGGVGQIDAAYAGIFALLPGVLFNVGAAVLLIRFITYWSFLALTGLVTFGAGFGELLQRVRSEPVLAEPAGRPTPPGSAGA